MMDENAAIPADFHCYLKEIELAKYRNRNTNDPHKIIIVGVHTFSKLAKISRCPCALVRFLTSFFTYLLAVSETIAAIKEPIKINE